MAERIGLIAGNGTFPLLVLDAARAQGFDVIVAAIKEEASPEIETHGAAAVHWLSLGELSRLIETFQREGVTPRHHGWTGQAQADFLQHPPRLAAGQVAAFAGHAQHRLTARRGGQDSGRRRHHAGEFNRVSGTIAGRGRRADQARAHAAGKEEHRIRARGGSPPGAVRHRTNRRRCRVGLRGRRSHGGH